MTLQVNYKTNFFPITIIFQKVGSLCWKALFMSAIVSSKKYKKYENVFS